MELGLPYECNVPQLTERMAGRRAYAGRIEQIAGNGRIASCRSSVLAKIELEIA